MSEDAVRWSTVFRQAPIGVLAIGVVLGLIGAGFVLGAAFFVLRGGAGAAPRWAAAAALALLGPLCLYLGIAFVRLHRWARGAVTALLLLLAVSAAVRVFTVEGPPVSPLVEGTVALLALLYLCRPRVRGAFEP
jgi:hypothetical protein